MQGLWITAERLGTTPEALRVAEIAFFVLLAGASVWLARRAPARAPLALSLGVASLLAIPGEDDTKLAVDVVLGTLASLAALTVLFRLRVRAPRWARLARVALYRASDARFDLATFGFVFAVATALSWFLFDWTPVIQDSQAQLFHARIFLTGHLVAPSPPSPEHFYADHILVTPAFYSQYPPGHSVFLALGALVGVPFLVNPALGALTVVLLRRVGVAYFDARTGRRAALLAACSPFVLWMSSEAMNHASALVLVLVGMLALARTRRAPDGSAPTTRAALLASLATGLALGGVLLIRPVTALAVGVPLGLHALRTLSDSASRWKLAPMLAGAFVMGLALLAFNHATNGSPFLMGYIVRWGPSHSLGFHAAPWGDTHTPLRGLDHTFSELLGLSLFLFGGAIPGLTLPVLGAVRDRRSPLTWELLLMPTLVLGIYFFYFFQDLTFGPRFLYEASPAFFLLGARGLALLDAQLAPSGRAERRGYDRALLAVLVTLVVPFLHFLPALTYEYQVGYCPRGHVVDRAEARIHERPALVFVDGAYERAFYAVDPELRAPILFAKDLDDAANTGLRCAMPERAAWRARGDVLEALPPLPSGACARADTR